MLNRYTRGVALNRYAQLQFRCQDAIAKVWELPTPGNVEHATRAMADFLDVAQNNTVLKILADAYAAELQAAIDQGGNYSQPAGAIQPVGGSHGNR